MVAANGKWLAQPQFVELMRAVRFAVGVNLVYREDDGLVPRSEDLSHFNVGNGDALGHVHDHDDDVGILDGSLDLESHLAPQVSVREQPLARRCQPG